MGGVKKSNVTFLFIKKAKPMILGSRRVCVHPFFHVCTFVSNWISMTHQIYPDGF